MFSFRRVIALTTIAVQTPSPGTWPTGCSWSNPKSSRSACPKPTPTPPAQAALPTPSARSLTWSPRSSSPAGRAGRPTLPRMADFGAGPGRTRRRHRLVDPGDLPRPKSRRCAWPSSKATPSPSALYRLATATGPGGLPPTAWEGTAAELLSALRHRLRPNTGSRSRSSPTTRASSAGNPRGRTFAAEARGGHPGPHVRGAARRHHRPRSKQTIRRLILKYPLLSFLSLKEQKVMSLMSSTPLFPQVRHCAMWDMVLSL